MNRLTVPDTGIVSRDQQLIASSQARLLRNPPLRPEHTGADRLELEQAEQCVDYPACINPNCCYWDHRRHCPEYAAALQLKYSKFWAVEPACLRERQAVWRDGSGKNGVSVIG